MTPRIEKAVEESLEMLKENKLKKGRCSACWVGNHFGGWSDWSERFVTVYSGQTIWTREEIEKRVGVGHTNRILKKIESSPFSEAELMKIEYAFETGAKIHSVHYYQYTPEEIRADQLKGLEAVIEVMLDFDDVKESVQEVFTSKAELIPIT